MELLLLLTYTSICVVIFKAFKLPLNKWTVPTAALGGAIIIGALVLVMNYNHPYTYMAREFFVTTPIVPGVTGIVTAVEVEPNKLVEKGTVLFRIDPKPFESVVRQKQALLAGSETGVEELIHLCNMFINLPSNPATKIRGVGASYASALAAAYFLTLIPVLDRRVLNGAVANGAAIDFELDTNGQVRNIQDHFGSLIRYCHATLVENPGQTLRQLDFALFIVPTV